MSAITTTINPLTTARMEELDNVEKDVIAILENTGEEAGAWRPNSTAKLTFMLCFAVL